MLPKACSPTIHSTGMQTMRQAADSTARHTAQHWQQASPLHNPTPGTRSKPRHRPTYRPVINKVQDECGNAYIRFSYTESNLSNVPRLAHFSYASRVSRLKKWLSKRESTQKNFKVGPTGRRCWLKSGLRSEKAGIGSGCVRSSFRMSRLRRMDTLGSTNGDRPSKAAGSLKWSPSPACVEASSA